MSFRRIGVNRYGRLLPTKPAQPSGAATLRARPRIEGSAGVTPGRSARSAAKWSPVIRRRSRSKSTGTARHRDWTGTIRTPAASPPGNRSAGRSRARGSDRSRTFRGTDAQRFWKLWPRATSFGQALQDLLASRTGEPERDPAIEIDPLEHNRERRVALRPPRIGQVLLRRVRGSARPQEDGDPAQPDDRFRRPQELAALAEHG